MKRTSLLAILTLLLAAPLLMAEAPTRRVASEVHAMLKRMALATVQGDQTIWVDALPPEMLERNGGRDATMKATLEVADQLAALGYQFTHYEVYLPKEMHRYKSGVILFAETRIVIAGFDRSIHTSGFLVASRNNEGERWFVTDGSSIPNLATLNALFPGLPEKMALPKITTETVMN